MVNKELHDISADRSVGMEHTERTTARTNIGIEVYVCPEDTQHISVAIIDLGIFCETAGAVWVDGLSRCYNGIVG